MLPTLGEELRDHREMRGMTLREVEKRSGISNGYLTQLENNKIKEPSPNILYKLSQVYNVPYRQLMKAAGYIVPAPEKQSKTAIPKPGNPRRHLSFALSTLHLEPEEEDALIDYLKFLKFKTRKKK